MMFYILIVFTALLFYFIGYFAGNYQDIPRLSSRIKRKMKGNKSGVIEYISAENESYYGSEQEKIDKQQEALLKDAGLV